MLIKYPASLGLHELSCLLSNYQKCEFLYHTIDFRMDENEDLGLRDEEITYKVKRRCPGLGIVFAIIACFFFAIGSIVVKFINDVGGITLSISRFSVQFLLLLPLLTHWRNEVDILGPVGLRKFLYLRGVFGGLCVPTLYLAIKRMDVGDAVTISYMSTILLPILARIFLKEKLTFLEIALCFISVCGVVLIARPTFLFRVEDYEPVDELGVLSALLGAIFQACSMTTIRKLGKTNAFLNITYFSICGCAMSLPLLPLLEEITIPCFEELLYFFSLGVLGIIGQLFLTLALRWEKAATVGVARSVQVIFAYMLQILILGHIPSVLSLVGSGIIFSCCIILGIAKVMRNIKNSSR